jgi:tetratricopeptide (TPR) repeat protein
MKQLLIVTIGVLLSFQTASAQEQHDAHSATLSEARKLINDGNPKAAIIKLQSLPDIKSPRIAQLLGVAYYHTNDLVRAIEILKPLATKFSSDSTEARETVQVLGLALYLTGQINDAIPFLEQTRNWAPNNNELAYALGMAFIQTRQPAKARDSFARMFGVTPDSASAHLVTAQMMIRLELEELAETELKQAIEKDPKLPQAHYLLGQIAVYRTRYDEGIALLEKEIALNPGNAMAYYKLGDAYSRQLKWDEAIAPLQKSIWLNPYYSGPYILLGKSYLKKRNYPSAEGMLKRAIQFDPNNKSAHYMLGQVLQLSGRAEDAKREFAIAEKLQASSDKIDQD